MINGSTSFLYPFNFITKFVNISYEFTNLKSIHRRRKEELIIQNKSCKITNSTIYLYKINLG